MLSSPVVLSSSLASHFSGFSSLFGNTTSFTISYWIFINHGDSTGAPCVLQILCLHSIPDCFLGNQHIAPAGLGFLKIIPFRSFKRFPGIRNPIALRAAKAVVTKAIILLSSLFYWLLQSVSSNKHYRFFQCFL
jgi:hypothetical protein